MDEAILNERMIQLKRARSGYTSVLTRRKNELVELMKSHDQVSVEAIKRKNDEIDETFNMFAVAHVNVHSQLVEAERNRTIRTIL
jgi:hypothetical protein